MVWGVRVQSQKYSEMVGVGFIDGDSPVLRWFLFSSLGANWWVVNNLSCFYGGPLVSFNPDTDRKQSAENHNGLHTHLFSLIHLRFGGPVEEFSDVLGHLGGGSGSAVVIFDETIKQNTGHSNSCIISI